MQHIINLDLLAKNDKPKFGELKLTVAQFFRINGGSTQLRGVTPDIPFPVVADSGSFGESSFENALPWVQIKAADYSPSGHLKSLLPILLMRYEARVTIDKDFKSLKEDIAELKLQRRKNQVSLNEAERRKERDVLEARLTSRMAQRNAGKIANEKDVGQAAAQEKVGALLDDGLQADERNLNNEIAAEKARKTARDILLSEAVRILNDEVNLLELFSTGG